MTTETKRMQADEAVRAGRRARDGKALPVEPKHERSTVDVVCAGDVVPEKVSWLWPGRIPLGKVTVIDGDPGLGKSTLTLDVAARVSVGGDMPDVAASLPAADVVILTAEDGIGDTVRPRLEAAGANVWRVHVLHAVLDENGTPRLPSLPDDLKEVEELVLRTSAKLVIIDPLMAFLGASVDSHTDHDVRRALAPIARMAEDTQAAVLVVRHLNKSVAKALYRGGGSIAIAGAARCVLAVGVDPNDPGVRVLAVVKSNLAARAPSLAFTLVSVGDVARLDWRGVSIYDADSIIAPPAADEDRGAFEEARDFVDRLLRDSGGYIAAAEAVKLTRSAGLAHRTVQRARLALGIRIVRTKFGGPCYWQSPGVNSTPAASRAEMARMDPNGEREEEGPPCSP